MAASVHGHFFRNYGAEECICMQCGFVTWMVTTPEEADKALREIGGGTCPKVWHGEHGELTPLPKSDTMQGMSEIKRPFRVIMRESERGWGSKLEKIHFETLLEARECYREQSEHNAKVFVDNGGRVPDYYYQAEHIEQLVDKADGSRVWEKVQ